jgi:hypothetical protein
VLSGRLSRAGERGAVLVLVAVLMFPIMLFAAFAIDVGHWWVHKRHLQTQADAGALAGALGPWLPVCDEAAIESAARQYASHLGAGYNPQYTNAANVHVLLNSTAYWNQGGSDFTDGGTPCSQLMNATADSPPAFLDVKATEADLPNLFGAIPGFSVVPAINSHARVEIQQVQGETGVRPIAVRDDSAYQCAQVILRQAGADGSTGAQIGSPIPLPARTTGTDASGSYTQFQNPDGATVTMPSPAQNIYVQVALGDCAGNDDIFPQDDRGSPAGGVNFINVYSEGSSSDPIVRDVTLQNGGCSPDQYFSRSVSCGVTVRAQVDFSGGATGIVRINGSQARGPGGSGVYTASFAVDPRSGPNQYKIDVEQQTGSTSKGKCTAQPNNKCKFSFGVEQQAYAATDDETADSNSGPLVLVQIGEKGKSTVGANSFERGTTHTLVFTVRVGGLQNSQRSDPPVVLRYDNQSSKRTGAVDCGQGSSGGPQLAAAIVAGCPSPIYLWSPGEDMVSPNDVSAPTPINAVVPVPGNKNGTGVIDGLKQLIGDSCNHWNAYRDSGAPIPEGDPRLVTMVITPPSDLNGGGGASAEVPVVNLAKFYVTGIDNFHPGNGTGCENEPYPGNSNKQSIKRAAVWGHWVKYVQVGGTGTGKACTVNTFGDCVAVLTQ